MICRQCGSEVQEGSVFCPHCGVRLQEAAGVRAEGQSETAVPKEVVREAADVRAAVQEEAVDVKTAAPEENVKEAPDMPEFEMAEQKKPEGPEQRAERSWQPEAASVTAADVPVIGAEASGAVSSTAANTSSAAAAVPSAAMKPEKPKGKKKVVIVGIAIAAVIVAAVLLAAALFPKGSQEWDVYGKDAIYCIQSDDEIKILNIASGKVTKGPETSYVVSSRTSIDATKQYIFSYDGLYLVSGDTWTEVSDEHTAGGVQMSVYGDGIVYLTVDADDGYEMYLYDTAKKESVLVTEERLWANCSIVISADGKSVAYMDGQSNRCCLYINGKEQEDTIKGAYPIALSSGGKYFYYVKNSSFYVMEQGKDAQKLGDEPSRLIFNKDMTQLLYSCNSKTYFCKNGEKAEETVAKGTVFPILPDNVQSLQDTVYTENDSCSVTVYGIKDLSGLVCDINDGLYYIDKDMSAQRIVSSYTVCEVSADGTALLYLRGDSLYRVKNLKKSLEPEEIEEVSGFAANQDLNRIYYLNDDNELMYFGGSGEQVKIYDDDIENLVAIGDKLYFIGDYSRGTGTLYVSDKGSKRKSIAEVTAIENIMGTLYYITEDDELYMLDGDKPVKVLDDIAN